MNARYSRALTTLAASLALAFPLASSAAFDAFLKLDGIEGESTDDKHKGEIVIESWSVGATQTLSPAGGGGGAGKSCVSDLSLVKLVDKASPALLGATMVGVHIPTAVISVRKAGGTQQDYLIYTMKDVLVSSVSQTSGGDLPTESISLNFASIKLSYRLQNPDGSVGAPIEATASGRC